MNLAPIRVEHAHGEGARRPIRVDDKRDRAGGVPSVGVQLAEDGRPAVEKLDSVLHYGDCLLGTYTARTKTMATLRRSIAHEKRNDSREVYG